MFHNPLEYSTQYSSNMEEMEIKIESERPITLGQLISNPEIKEDDEIWSISYGGSLSCERQNFEKIKAYAIIKIKRPKNH